MVCICLSIDENNALKSSYRDTVNSVGLIPRRLPFTRVNDNIKYFRHAMSLDERRMWVDFRVIVIKKRSSFFYGKNSRFVPSIWYRATPHDKIKGIKKHEMPRSKPHHVKDRHARARQLSHFERQYSEAEATTNVEEVWFAGCHCGTFHN